MSRQQLQTVSKPMCLELDRFGTILLNVDSLICSDQIPAAAPHCFYELYTPPLQECVLRYLLHS